MQLPVALLRACVFVCRLLPLLLSSNQYDVSTAYQLLPLFPNPTTRRLTTTPNLIMSMLRHVTGLYMDGSGRQRIPSQIQNRTWTRRQIPNPTSLIIYVVRSRARRERRRWCLLRHHRSWKATLLELLRWLPVQVYLSLCLSVCLSLVLPLSLCLSLSLSSPFPSSVLCMEEI